MNSFPLLLDGNFPDPYVVRHEGGWTALSTGRDENGRPFPTLRSSDGERWTRGPGALTTHLDGGDWWAPEIVERDGIWFLYASVGQGDAGHRLRVAKASRSEGPYEDLGELADHPPIFQIDPHPFRDDEGRWWLFSATDIVEGDRPGTSLVVQPLDDPTRVKREWHVVARATADWQIYERRRPIYDALHDWHTLEGPNVVRDPAGGLFLLYSGGNWQNETYGVDFVSASRVDAEWDNPPVASPRVLRSRPGLRGPGHNSTYEGPHGERMIAFHAWDATGVARRPHVAPIAFTEDGPRVEGLT